MYPPSPNQLISTEKSPITPFHFTTCNITHQNSIIPLRENNNLAHIFRQKGSYPWSPSISIPQRRLCHTRPIPSPTSHHLCSTTISSPPTPFLPNRSNAKARRGSTSS